MTLLLVALGGAFGAMTRHLTVLAAARTLGPNFPWGVAIANVAGSFAMGVLAALLLERSGAASRFAPLILTGFLGGFTTFSAFSLDFARLVETGRLIAALAYAGGSVILSLCAVFFGLMAGRAI